VGNEIKSNDRLNLRFTKIGENFWTGVEKSGENLVGENFGH